jgi:myosin heavy subunit
MYNNILFVLQMKSALTKEQGLYVRDALAKGIYDRLFTWIVQKINESLTSRVSNSWITQK